MCPRPVEGQGPSTSTSPWPAPSCAPASPCPRTNGTTGWTRALHRQPVRSAPEGAALIVLCTAGVRGPGARPYAVRHAMGPGGRWFRCAETDTVRSPYRSEPRQVGRWGDSSRKPIAATGWQGSIRFLGDGRSRCRTAFRYTIPMCHRNPETAGMLVGFSLPGIHPSGLRTGSTHTPTSIPATSVGNRLWEPIPPTIAPNVPRTTVDPTIHLRGVGGGSGLDRELI